MMKRLSIPAVFVVLFIFGLMACKKDSNSSPTLHLTVADTGKTQVVTYGGKISLTLGNPGDGGYYFDSCQYNTSVLKLVSHTHANPSSNAAIGDFGTDTWQFSTLQTGTSQVVITASRGNTSTIAMFNGSVQVK